jgi:hypothetical protein
MPNALLGRMGLRWVNTGSALIEQKYSALAVLQQD